MFERRRVGSTRCRAMLDDDSDRATSRAGALDEDTRTRPPSSSRHGSGLGAPSATAIAAVGTAATTATLAVVGDRRHRR